jgi:hypothetical protein
MTKITLIAFILLAAGLFSSCEKDTKKTPEQLLIGNWEFHGTDSNGEFTMFMKINDNNTGTTDLYEFEVADFNYTLADGKITMSFDNNPDFTPNPAICIYSFANDNEMTFDLLDENNNIDMSIKWVRSTK